MFANNDEILENDYEETVHRLLRDLLEIIFRLVQQSKKYNEHFLDEGMFMLIVTFLDKKLLIEFLFENYVNTLSKVIAVFYWLCKKLYYAENKADYVEEPMFTILLNGRHTMESLSQQDERKGLQEKPIYRMYLIALSYVQEAFKKRGFLTVDHYRVIATRGFIPKCFSQVSDEYRAASTEIVPWEFINEYDEAEVAHVSRLLVSGTSTTAINTIVDALNCLCVINANDEAKKIAYESYRYFIKSVIYFGLCVEKILCVRTLIKFCTEDYVRKDVLEDTELVDYLRKIYIDESSSNADVYAKRLNVKIGEFFAMYGFKGE